MTIITDGRRAITAELRNWDECSQSWGDDYLYDIIGSDNGATYDDGVWVVDDVDAFIEYIEGELIPQNAEIGIETSLCIED